MSNGIRKAWESEENGKVFLAKNISSVDVLRLAIDHNINQIVQESNPKVETEVQAGLVMLNAPGHFFDFPLSTVLCPSDSPSREIEIKSCLYQSSFHRSNQKSELLDHLAATVQKVSHKRSLLEDARLVSDELISNAIYNAPFSSENRTVDRRTKIELDPARSARFLIGADSERLVIVCEDQFGSLDIKAFLSRIKGCYEAGVAKMINHGEGGAGIGSHMIFDSCVSLYCGVEKGRRTTFACVFPLNANYRSRAQASKNIHVVAR